MFELGGFNLFSLECDQIGIKLKLDLTSLLDDISDVIDIDFHAFFKGHVRIEAQRLDILLDMAHNVQKLEVEDFEIFEDIIDLDHLWDMQDELVVVSNNLEQEFRSALT